MEEKPINFIEEPDLKKEKNNNQFFKKVGIFTILMFFVIFSIIAFASSRKVNYTNETLEYDSITMEPKKPVGLLKKISYFVFKKETKLEGEKKDRVNILIMGIGGVGHDGPFLTDTIMIASLKPSTGEVALISIPRDLGVNIPNYGLRKINSANAFGEIKKTDYGGAYATEIISKTLNIEIPYYIRIDFKAFSEIIDQVEGITVNVEKTFTDYEYPTSNYKFQTINFKEGEQIMNGDSALKYARSRHGNNGEGSDFARARRQQKILLALKEKILSYDAFTNPLKIKEIIDSLEKHMISNLEFPDLLYLVKKSKEINTDKIITLVLDDSTDGFLQNTFSPSGAWLVVPKTGNFEEINTAIKNIFDKKENQKILNISESTTNLPQIYNDDLSESDIEIQNGTWEAGIAKRTQTKLIAKKFSVYNVGNTDSSIKPIDKSIIYNISNQTKNEMIISAIANELKIDIGKNLPDKIKPITTSTDILIILGEDFIE